MDRGLFPLYYLHLERDYGKKVFLLAGKYVNEHMFVQRMTFLYLKIDFRSKEKEK